MQLINRLPGGLILPLVSQPESTSRIKSKDISSYIQVVSCAEYTAALGRKFLFD
jgi:hypothetical protein